MTQIVQTVQIIQIVIQIIEALSLIYNTEIGVAEIMVDLIIIVLINAVKII